MSNAPKTSNKGVHSELTSLQVALATGLCIAGATAFAQETATLSTVTVTDSAENPFQANSVPLPQFTAPLIDTPKTVQVITEEVMEQTGATSLTEALKTTPGITFGSGEGGNPSGDRPFMRGSDAQSSIFVDGLRDIGASNREVFNLESVQVIKGADSAYTGRGGAGGSINLTTKKAKGEDFITGDVGLGTDKYKRATVDLNRKLNDTTGFRLNAMAHDADVPGRNGPENKRWGIAPTVTFGMNTPTQVTLSYEHLQTDDMPDGGVPYALGSSNQLKKINTPTTIQPTFGGNRDNWYGLQARDFRKEKSDVFSAAIEHKFSDSNKIRNATRYGKSKQDYVWTQPDDSQGNVENGQVWRRMNSRYSETETLQNVTELTGEATAAGFKHQFALGLELSRETSDVDGYTLLNAAGQSTCPVQSNGKDSSLNSSACAIGGYAPGTVASLTHPNGNDAWDGSIARNKAFTHYKTETVSLYGFDTVTLAPDWLLNAGLRVDSYRTKQWSDTNSTSYSRNDTLFNYQLGLVYKLQPNASIYASTGTSSTPGGNGNGQSADGTIDSSNSGRTPTLNADQLKPEKTRSYEIGTKWDVLNQQLSLTAALFRNETSNARVRDPNTSLASMVGKKHVNGLELGFSGRITPKWDVFGGYTYMDSKQKDIGTTKDGMPAAGTGMSFPNTPKHSASLWTSYKFTPKLTMGVGAIGQSESVAGYAYGGANSNVLITKATPGYVRYDAMLSYALNPNLRLQVNVYNLTDKVYYASSYSSHYATLGAGRSAVATLKFTY